MTVRRKRIQKRRFALIAVGALAGSLLSVAPAWAATCSMGSGGVYTVTAASGTTTIAKNGSDLEVTGCSDVLVSTVFDVKVNGASGNSNETITFLMTGGLFDEDSQVPFELALGNGTDKVVVTGTDDRDVVSFGTEGMKMGVSGPAQVTWTSMATGSIESIDVNGGADPDLLAANGSGTGDPWTNPSTINGELGNDTLIGGDGADALNGGDGHDGLDGGAGADTETGGTGNDTFGQDSGSNGADDLIGGDGADRVDYSRRADAVRATVDTGATDGQTSPAENDEILGVEEILGGDGDDILAASVAQTDPDLAPRHYVDGGDGNDTMTGGHGVDNLLGGDGDDTINGEPGNAAALSAACTGDAPKTCRDVIDGGGDNDTINGGPGNDSFLQGRSADGNDTINGGGDTDTVKYNSRTADLTIVMNGSTNSGDLGASEDDTIHTDVENAFTGSGDDAVTGNDNVNKITMSGGVDDAAGGDGNDRLFGNGGDDTINGDDDDDTLYGGGGKDKLFGDAGSNTIHGGSGFDVCQNFSKKSSCP